MLFDKKPLCVYFFYLDECTTGYHSCDVNSVCQNTLGSYKCSCNAGTQEMENLAMVFEIQLILYVRPPLLGDP